MYRYQCQPQMGKNEQAVKAEKAYLKWLQNKCMIFKEEYGIMRTCNPKKFKIVDFKISNMKKLGTKNKHDLVCRIWDQTNEVL